MPVDVGAVTIGPIFDAVGLLGEYEELYPDVPAEAWEPYRSAYPGLFAGSRWRLQCTCYVVRSGGVTMLVDTGAGPPGMWDWAAEEEGGLPNALAEAGVRVEDVDVVFLTHLHIDHLGWNTDVEGVPLFPHARYLVHADALAHALERPDRPHIRRCVEPLADRFEQVADGDELAPGVRARALRGHYPGHMGLSIHSDAGRAELIGDLAPHPALLDRPEWVFAFDEFEQTSTRAELVREVADTETLVVCGHYPGSGIGRIGKEEGRLTWREA